MTFLCTYLSPLACPLFTVRSENKGLMMMITVHVAYDLT